MAPRKKGGKRKRADSVSSVENGVEEVPDSIHFQVIYTKGLDVKPTKRKSSSKKDDNTAPRQEAGVTAADKPVTYMISPGSKWDAMKKYKNFIVGERQYATGDFVYVNNGSLSQGEETDDDHKFYIARVLEVRAVSSSEVYLRVYWLYWPDELPLGAQYYHGRCELVASNHMEIIDAMTVSSKAEVDHLLEDADAPVATNMYWRQRFDFLTNKLSPLRRGCICKKYHNPDKLLIHCVNPDCSKWMHSDCVIKDATEKAWAKLTHPNIESAIPDSDIPADKQGPTSDGDETIQVVVKEDSPAATTNGRRGRVHKKKKLLEDEPAKVEIKDEEVKEVGLIEGKLEAKLQMKEIPEGADDTVSPEITGTILITDLRDGELKTWEEPLSCLFCDHSLQ